MIRIRSACLHNLKNVDIEIPENAFTVVTGVSGSGKSTAIFDILFEEGKRAYLEALGMIPAVDRDRRYEDIEGLMPAIAVTQKTAADTNPRSVVGTRTGILDLLRDVFSLWGDIACSRCGCICTADASGRGSMNGNPDVHKHGSVLLCPNCGNTERRPGPYAFSFNSVHGMCLHCMGRGYMDELDIDRIIGDDDTTLSGICRKVGVSMHKERLEEFYKLYGISGRASFSQIPSEAQDIFLSGRPGVLKGLLSYLAGRPVYDRLEYTKTYICTECGGERLRPEARRVTVAGCSITVLSHMTVKDLRLVLEGWLYDKPDVQKTGATLPTKGVSAASLDTVRIIIQKLGHLENAGLSHLSLYRPMPTLSGGEAQRLFLASHIESEMGSVIYIFDEPTSGLHEAEKKALVSRLSELKKNNNTVIAIEHDRNTILSAEHIIDFGPLGGRLGGEVVYSGPAGGLLKAERSLTAAYLSGAGKLPERRSRYCIERIPESCKRLTLSGVRTNNLKNIDIEVPLGMITGIAGVSGSGKSSLIESTLIPALKERFGDVRADEEECGGDSVNQEEVYSQAVYDSIRGAENISGYSEIYQKPIGRNRRSIPLSYAGIWDDIRALFARHPSAVGKGFKAGHFSFNSSGACKGCRGLGSIDKYMGELGYVTLTCPDCEGDRYSDEILCVRYKGASIKDVLNMCISDAAELFSAEPRIHFMLETLVKTGLGYLKCGQSVSTLSGGEAQRIKLAEELGKRRKGNVLYILDEPTTGLSFHDTAMLLTLLDSLCEGGNSIIIIEHDIDVLKFCDYIIELGPGGGNEGGEVIACGSPDVIKENVHSVTGRYF